MTEKELDDGIEKPWDDLFLEQGGLGVFMIHGIFRLTTSSEATHKRPVVGCERIMNLQSHDEF